MTLECVLPLFACICNDTMFHEDGQNNYTDKGASLECFGSARDELGELLFTIVPFCEHIWHIWLDSKKDGLHAIEGISQLFQGYQHKETPFCGQQWPHKCQVGR